MSGPDNSIFAIQGAVLSDIERANADIAARKTDTVLLAGTTAALLFIGYITDNFSIPTPNSEASLTYIASQTLNTAILVAPKLGAIYTGLMAGATALHGLNAMMRKNSLIGALTSNALRTGNTKLYDKIREMK